MAYKINISEKGKTYRIETELDSIEGKQLGEKIKGAEIKPELDGYELEITGASDKAGFPSFKEIEGPGLKRVLLTKGKGMKGWNKRRKKSIKVKGLRRKKTVRGNVISKDTMQINLSVKKEGHKKLDEIFPEQAKARADKEIALKAKIEASKAGTKPAEISTA